MDLIFSSGAYDDAREVTRKVVFDPGYYIIIPSTFKIDQNSEFLLRIFTERPVNTL